MYKQHAPYHVRALSNANSVELVWIFRGFTHAICSRDGMVMGLTRDREFAERIVEDHNLAAAREIMTEGIKTN